LYFITDNIIGHAGVIKI